MLLETWGILELAAILHAIAHVMYAVSRWYLRVYHETLGHGHGIGDAGENGEDCDDDHP